VSCRWLPAPRFDCSSGLRGRNLPVATLWPSPTSGTNRVVDASGPRRAEATKLAQGIVRWSRWKGQTKLVHGMVRWDRWRGQTELAQGMIRWTDGWVKRKLALGVVRWTDGRVKPSWRTAWSVGIDGRVKRPTPWLWSVVGCSDPLRVPKIQGMGSGQQDDRFGPA
jgi:hypothetical protein